MCAAHGSAMKDAALENRVQEREQSVEDRWLCNLTDRGFPPYMVMAGAIGGAAAGSSLISGDHPYATLAGMTLGGLAGWLVHRRRDALYHQNYPALADLVAREKEFYAHPHFQQLKPRYRDALLLDYLSAALWKQEGLQVIDTVKKHLSPQRAGVVHRALEEYVLNLTLPFASEEQETLRDLSYAESVVRRDEFSPRERRRHLNVIATEYFTFSILKDAERLWRETGNRRKLRQDLLPCYRKRQDYEKVRELMAL